MSSMARVSRRNFVAGTAVAGAVLATAAGAGAASEAKAQETADGSWVPGSYVGMADGRGGKISVEVTLGEDAIEGVRILSHSETPIISDTPLSRIPQQVVKHQSVAVDVVSHATLTSVGVLGAIKDALASANVPAEAFSAPIEADPVRFSPVIDAPIAIVGGGVCGLTAAVRAAQLGVPVVVFEQSSRLGGDALFGEGWFLGAGTLMETAAGEEDSGEQCWQELMDNLNEESQQWWDPELCERYHLNTGRTADWMDQYVHARFHNRELTHGTYGGGVGFAHRLYFTNGGFNLIQPLVDRLNEAVRDGLVSVLYQHEVTRLLTDESGAVCGVEAVDANGETAQFDFQAVFMATGGYHHNRAMVDELYGENVLSGGGSTSTGSGFALCEELGAQTVNMAGKGLMYAGGIPSKYGKAATITYDADPYWPGSVWIDVHGKRNWNERATTQIAHAAWRDADDATLFIVFPASKRLAYLPLINRAGGQDVKLTPNESWALFDELLEQGEYAFMADSAAELAQKLGVDDVDAFCATIDEVNACAASGAADSLGREGHVSFEGPLYAVKTHTVLHNTYGGIKRNGDFQVIDEQGNPIEGLYAGGELCGVGLVTPPTKVNTLGGGNGISGCANQGRVGIEVLINKLTGMDTELPQYVFEGDPADYDIKIYEAGDYQGVEPVFA